MNLFKGRVCYSSLLLRLSHVAFVLHYYIVLAHPPRLVQIVFDTSLSETLAKLLISVIRSLSWLSETESPCSNFPTENQNNGSTDKGFAKVFDRFDTNKDGKISSDKLHAYFTSIGEAMSNTEAQSVIEEFGKTKQATTSWSLKTVKLMEREGDGNEDLKRALRCLKLIRAVGA